MSSGQTDANLHHIIQGQAGGNFGLNATGQEQAKKAGQRLSGEVFTHAYVSDLQRTRDTIRLILGENQQWTDMEKVKVGVHVFL